MTELHDALKYLAPVDWADVPQDNLDQYMSDCFTAGELICNTVPPLAHGTPFTDSKPHHHLPNLAKSHRDMHPSTARSHPPHQEHEKLQKSWGKPMKFSAKDNPLEVAVYKTAGHDRHGAWFARRSVHEGLGFAKWKRAMMREFSETMTVTGGPGAGAIRGLAADRRLEKMDVPGVGRLEVFQLSAQFPGPVTPRDFMTMLFSTDDALSDKSAVELDGGKKHVPRHFMIVSKPVDHPDAPIRSGYVRGHYESVEMIREIPLSTSKSKSTPNLVSTAAKSESTTRERGHTVGFAESRGEDAKGEQVDKPHEGDSASDEAADDPELNPVEWIMVTRSDPGGGIPRFLVERGTPETMIADVHKFFNWACSQDYIADPDEDLQKQQESSEQEDTKQQQTQSSLDEGDGIQEGAQNASNAALPREASPGQQNGVISNLTKAIEVGFDSYAPAYVSNMVHQHLDPAAADHLTDDSSDTSSIDSFLSANEMKRITTAPEHPAGQPGESADSLSLASGDGLEASKDKKNMSSHEKELQKVLQKREKLDQQLAKKRILEEQKYRQMQEKDEAEANKAREEMEKKLKKTEEKHRREVEKLEQKKAKEARKVEERRQKKDAQTKISMVTRERDEFQSQSDSLRRENSLLREQIEDLQAQNTLMAQKLGKLGAQDTLKALQDELGHKRTKSFKSVGSAASSDSIQRVTEKKAEGE